MEVTDVPRIPSGDADPIVVALATLPPLHTALTAATRKTGLGTAYDGETISTVVHWDFRRCPVCDDNRMEKNIRLSFEPAAQLRAYNETSVNPCIDCAETLRDSVATYIDGKEDRLLGDTL